MCLDPACDSDNPPPPGEDWCPHRLNIEAVRWYTGPHTRSNPSNRPDWAFTIGWCLLIIGTFVITLRG